MGNQQTSRLSFLSMALAMTIFGTIGVFRRYIPLGSATLSAVRGFVGVAVILLFMCLTRKKMDTAAIRRNLWLLIISGACIGVNWILLFEAYNHTSIAVATLCYYMAPVMAILASPIVLKEKLTAQKLISVIVATLGMVLISGLFGETGGGDIFGVLFGLAAAAFYASVVLMNRKLKDIGAYDKTVVQLLSAAVTVLPYAYLTEEVPLSELTLPILLSVLALGIAHTGVAYTLYFSAMSGLSTSSIALLGYIDPIVAIILSVVFLNEPFGILEALGVICILGATVFGEFPLERIKKQ